MPAAALAKVSANDEEEPASRRPSASDGDERASAPQAIIRGGVAAWGESRSPEAFRGGSVRAAASDGPAPLGRPDPATAPSRARPRGARAALVSGAVLVAASAAAFSFPALTPAALAVMKGPALYAGFALMSLSRLWRAPGSGVESPRGPPAAPAWLTSARAWMRAGRVRSLAFSIPASLLDTAASAWTAASGAADSQAALESRAGGSSAKSFRDWFLGGLRSGVMWLPVAIATMVAGVGLAKPFERFANPDNAIGMLSFDDVEKFSLGGHLLGFVAASLAAEAVVLGAFDAFRALAARLGAGRASGLIAGAAALAVSAGIILLVTTTPSVIGTMLGIEAGLLWLRARSNSWLGPIALRGLFSLISLEFTRLGLSLAVPTAAASLVGLPAVWTGVAVAGLLFGGLAWSARSLRPSALWSAFQAQVRRVKDFGAQWTAPRADGAPHSPWPLMKLAALWGWILYALGDLTYSGVHAISGGTEPTPAILAQMLSSPVDLVLANFLLVGFLEEFVFRRGIFKPILNFVSKWKQGSPKLFWTAAVVSGLIFSYAHYIDFGAMLGQAGPNGASSGLGGMYAFTLGGFLSRAALGVVLAWLYAASGTLLLPIFAHFLADSYEGLGLRFGFWPFLAMAAAGVLLQLQRVWKTGKTQRS
jgi:membrane protease YdiL (CAAX protease family)